MPTIASCHCALYYYQPLTAIYGGYAAETNSQSSIDRCDGYQITKMLRRPSATFSSPISRHKSQSRLQHNALRRIFHRIANFLLILFPHKSGKEENTSRSRRRCWWGIERPIALVVNAFLANRCGELRNLPTRSIPDAHNLE